LCAESTQVELAERSQQDTSGIRRSTQLQIHQRRSGWERQPGAAQQLVSAPKQLRRWGDWEGGRGGGGRLTAIQRTSPPFFCFVLFCFVHSYSLEADIAIVAPGRIPRRPLTPTTHTCPPNPKTIRGQCMDPIDGAATLSNAIKLLIHSAAPAARARLHIRAIPHRIHLAMPPNPLGVGTYMHACMHTYMRLSEARYVPSGAALGSPLFFFPFRRPIRHESSHSPRAPLGRSTFPPDVHM